MGKDQSWQFWRPLSLGKVLLIFVLTSLGAHLFVAALRQGLKLDVPIAVAGGIGGMLGVLIVGNLARKARTEEPKPNDPNANG